MNKAQIELTVRYGRYGEQSKTVCVPISAGLADELMNGVELSDEPFSVLLASPGAFGGKGDALTFRRKAFQMRRAVAQEIARAIQPALMNAFGVNDQLDGYKVDSMSQEERAWQKQRGRL